MTEGAPTRVVVLAAGNDARGDDALGPLLLARVEGLGIEAVRCVFDFQFQVEHALDLGEADLALFVDAHADQVEPARLGQIEAARRPPTGSHALSPDEVLQVYAQVCSADVPPCFVLSLRGEAFELGAGLSGVAEASLEAGWALARQLLDCPDANRWRTHCA